MKSKGIYCIILLVFAITVLHTSCKNNRTAQTFSLKDLAPVVMEYKGKEVFQYWEFENKPFLWGIASGKVMALKSYRDSLELELGTVVFRQVVEKEANQSNSPVTSDSENGDLINTQLVHSGNVGKIRPINYLEAELLN